VLQGGTGSPHACAAQLAVVGCPSFAGDRVAGPDKINTAATSPYTGNAQGALNQGQGCAISNYHACAGTHIDGTGGTGNGATKKIWDNAAFQFQGTGFDKGRGLAGMQDGTSKTVQVAETREQAMNCWIDGTTSWVVAARHSSAPAGNSAVSPVLVNNLTTTLNGQNLTGRWAVPNTTTGGHAVNVGPTTQYPQAAYMPGNIVTQGPNIVPQRAWGPSSNHAGGIVNHVCGDGHVAAISESVDPHIYIWGFTRSGGEPTTFE
jgi:hypothetical protein